MAGYCHCASIISGDASLHLHWIAPELTLRAMFKGEQFPSGGIPLLRWQSPTWALIILIISVRPLSFTAFCAALRVSCSCAEQELQALMLGAGN